MDNTAYQALRRKVADKLGNCILSDHLRAAGLSIGSTSWGGLRNRHEYSTITSLPPESLGKVIGLDIEKLNRERAAIDRQLEDREALSRELAELMIADKKE